MKRTTPPSVPSCCWWSLIGALFVYWYSDSREHQDFRRYEIYFDGSVSGLERGAAVRYLGVDVGRVQQMSHRSARSRPSAGARGHRLHHADIGQNRRGAVAAGRHRTCSTSTCSRTGRQLHLPPAVPEHEVSGHPLGSLPFRSCSWRRCRISLASAGEVVDRASRHAERQEHRLRSRTRWPTSTRPARDCRRPCVTCNTLVLELRNATTDLAAVGKGRTASRRTGRPRSHRRTAAGACGGGQPRERDAIRLDKLVDDNRQDMRSFTREGLPELERFLREGRAAAREFRRAVAAVCARIPRSFYINRRRRAVEIPR